MERIGVMSESGSNDFGNGCSPCLWIVVEKKRRGGHFSAPLEIKIRRRYCDAMSQCHVLICPCFCNVVHVFQLGT